MTSLQGEVITDFQALQEIRVREYKKLEGSFKVYLSSGPEYDFPSFQEAVGRTTKEFQDISQKILSLKERLEESRESDALKAHIEEVQRLEGMKLARTVEYQLLAQKAQDNPEDAVIHAKSRAALKEIHGLNEGINDALEEIRYIAAEES
eukprot:TRINITY_DN4366_c0_g1_i1.p1 TRINITY_DN4366_c0_g1~~TRINITY_DN4366_c0_g1_i1.p1  ORF type:complete len:150 (+),score=38.26 TRINITY_DN4366_c0_g1_i1:69-518(+)